MYDIAALFIVFFAVIDPIGTVPVFIAVTRGYDINEKRKIALFAFLAASTILLFFVLAGEYILRAMNVPLAAFQIAGGIVLFLFALSMIFGESKPEEEIKLAKNHRDTAVFPLAVPSIAGPGAMLTAVLLTEDARFSMLQQIQTAMVMQTVLLLAYLLMLGSTTIYRWIGDSGASVVSRVMGLVLSAVATTHTLNGIKLYFDF